MKGILFVLCWFLSIIVNAKLLSSDYALLNETENNSQFDLAWHSKLAGYGDPESLFFMAQVYEEGKLVPVNLAQAVLLYKKAATQGHLESMLKLANLLPAEQIKWLEEAGKKNYTPAQLKLANLYEDLGQKEQAIYWLERAMRQLFPGVEDLTTVSPKLKELKGSP